MSQQIVLLKQRIAGKKSDIEQKLKENGGVVGAVTRFFGLEDLEALDAIRESMAEIKKQNVALLKDFDKTREHIEKKGLSPAILKRYEAAREKTKNEMGRLDDNVARLEQASSLEDQESALSALKQQLDDHKLKRTFTPTDPNHLPWGAPDASKTRKPARTAAKLSQLTGISPLPQGTQVATNVITPDMLGQPGGPVAEDLAETIDVQLTDAIKTKAEALEYNPVKIYNWVRNNIEFIPSYGSIQGADYTLQHGKGNAFDTASLLIALLRASNIPARYVYGTVDIPADKVMNWVGGVDVPGAAQQLLGQGGIPNTGIVRGGKISTIEMEHVWVDAWIDYLPSRGAKHVTGDQWIPLDASFKQYKYTKGEDLRSKVPFDAQGLVDNVTQTATIDENAGYVQNVDQGALQDTLANYRQQIQDYIDNQNPDATVGDVLGTSKIIVQEHQQLTAGLPYTLVARTNNYSALPDSLRHKFRYTLSTELYGTEDGRLITFEKSLPELAGKKLALSFKPASQDDEDLIASYLPDPDPNTGEISPDQLPDSLPGYLISLTAELDQNGQVIASAPAGTMGGELYETLALWSPAFGWDQAVNHPVAGEYRAIGLDLQGASPTDAVRLQAEVESTGQTLEGGNEAEMALLTKHQVEGDLLYTTIYSYFALNDVLDQIQSQSADVVTNRMPSFGLFTTSLQTSYSYGVPRSVSFSGMVMDVDHLSSQVSAKDNTSEKRINFIRASGARGSAMEHLVPEQAFSTDTTPAQGISAVKALALASAQGQKIWTIDRANLDVAMANINLDGDIESEISNSVNAGNIVTVHERAVNFNGKNFVGYLLIDPGTGAGAYKISSGSNGGVLTTILAGISGYLDGLTRFKDHWFNAGNAAQYARISGFLTVISAVITIGQILTNPNLSVSQKISQIIINIGSAIATIGISEAIMANAFLAASNPILLGLLIATIAISISLITLNLLAYNSTKWQRRPYIIRRYA